MKKIRYNPDTLAEPAGHFDRAIQLGDWLFVSGTSAVTNVSGPLADRRIVEGVEAQTNEALDNIERVLATAGVGFESVYEVRIILRRGPDYAKVDEIMRERFPSRGFIAHAYEGVLLHEAMELEIEVNAFLGQVEIEERSRFGGVG